MPWKTLSNGGFRKYNASLFSRVFFQKLVATLCVPGAPAASKVNASAHRAPVKHFLRCVEVTAPPTRTSVNSACPRACRRRESKWPRRAVATKVGNGLWNSVMMLSNRPLKLCNHLNRLTWRTVFSHLCFFFFLLMGTRATRRRLMNWSRENDLELSGHK